MNKTLNKVRDDISKAGKSELEVLQDLPCAEDIWKQIQELRMQMNEAKRKAAEEAAKPYLKEITELEEQYALVLKLSS